KAVDGLPKREGPDGPAEELPESDLRPPLDRRADAGRRRGVPAVDPEDLADEAVGCVADEADPAAGPGDADQPARGPLLVRGEHPPEHRADDVKARVLEREGFRIALDEGRLEPLGPGPEA